MTAAAIDLAELPAPDAEGMIRARDGRAWQLDDPAALVARFSTHGADLPVDFDHSPSPPAACAAVRRGEAR